MALTINAKFERKLSCAFKNDMKNSDFTLESKMAELSKNNNSYITTSSTRCSVKTLFYIGDKWIAQLTKLVTHVLQIRCS